MIGKFLKNILNSPPKEIRIKDNRTIENFIHLNQQRLQRAMSMLKPKQAIVIDLIPLLFENNQPTWPGYIGNDVPCGISYFQRDERLLDKAKNLFGPCRFVEAKERPLWALYAMGSIGTIAHTPGSDFDFLLLHDPALSEVELKLLQKKATAIETYAVQSDIEVHFFLINPAKMRRGEMNALSSESSGSAQFRLLLDEIYRTLVVFSGRWPAWWLIAPELEERYDEELAYYQQARYYRDRFVDLGALPSVGREEYFGGVIWQFVKAISSPYKSIIKLTLIESYVANQTELPVLSRQFKQRVYSGVTDVDEVDPYRMLSQHLESYLQYDSEPHRLLTLRRAFYLKNGLSRMPGKIQPQWKIDLHQKLMADWGWNSDAIKQIEQRQIWSLQLLIEERCLINRTLSDCYTQLAQFLHHRTQDIFITEADMTQIGRKLFAFYERKAHKIELIRFTVGHPLAHDKLSLHEEIDDAGIISWGFYSGYVGEPEPEHPQLIRRFAFLVEGLVWCYSNAIWTESTQINLFYTRAVISQQEIQQFGKLLRQHFTIEKFNIPPIERFADPNRIASQRWFIHLAQKRSIGFDPSLCQGEGLGREPLCFSIRRQLLLVRFDWVYTTEYGELFHYPYQGGEGLAQAIENYFNWFTMVKSGCQLPILVHFSSFDGDLGKLLAQRLEQLFTTTTETFFGATRLNDGTLQLWIAIGPQWLLLRHCLGSLMEVETYANDREVVQTMSRQSPSTTRFDAPARYLHPLAVIYSEQRLGEVVLVVQPLSGDGGAIWIVDEEGQLYHQLVKHQLQQESLAIYYFLQLAARRLNALTQQEQPRVIKLLKYKLKRDKSYCYHLLPLKLKEESTQPPLSLLVEVGESQPILAVAVNQQLYSEQKQGAAWPKLARQRWQQAGGCGTIHINGLRLRQSVTIARLLRYRQKITRLLLSS
ncbi:hypothetical protein D5085_04470 [Ectothiorhodospiraceae bacterium BW-2]|nr:hypothetical protein D5085_04470 [Ectothiorhodospiraceae bacterium BW-2]